MSKDRDRTARLDSQWINTHEPYDVFEWAVRFGVSQDCLKEAVKKVGALAADVQRELQRGRA